jgi:hypothetical protein
MSGEHSALLAQLRSARTLWVDLEEGKAVQFLRPLEADVELLLQPVAGGGRGFRLGIADLRRYAVGWRGITEADLLGKPVGSDDAVSFDAEVLELVLGDNLDWLHAAIEGLTNAIVARLNARVAARGNSSATSTPGQQPAPTVAPA